MLGALLAAPALAVAVEVTDAGYSSCGGWSGQPTVCVDGWDPFAGCEETRKARNIAIASHNNPITGVTSALDTGQCYGVGPNYSTPVLYGGWWSTRTCPSGQTLSGTKCYGCPAPFTYVPATQSCASACDGGVPAACDDGDACTVDGCDDATGCTHTPLSCDDGKSCTVDACDADAGACAFRLEKSACTCDSPPAPTLTASPSKDLELGSLSCPTPLPGSLGATLKLSGEGSYTGATCGNGCQSSASLSGTAALDLSLCGANVAVTASGSYSQSRKHDLTCDEGTCGTGCSAGYCGTDEGSGSLGLSHSRFFGYDWSEALPGGGKVFARCGATLAGGASVSGGITEVANQGAAQCEACLTSTMSLTGEASAAATCAYGVSMGWVSKEVGCQNCASVKASVSGTATAQAGACGSQTCNALSGKVSAALTTPNMKLGLKWWTVDVACTASLEACREANSCGSCACGGGACSDFKPQMSCSVCTGNSLLPLCRKSNPPPRP